MKRVVGSLAVTLFSAFLTVTWVVDAAAVTSISSCPQQLSKAGETYVLTGNLTAFGDCLTVASDRVTIDFRSFSITGDGSTGAAVTDGGVARALTVVKNGGVESFETGIDLAASARSEVRSMSVRLNVGDGIALGARGLVKACFVEHNGGYGVVVGDFGQVQDCLVNANGNDGIHAGSHGLITKNLSQSGQGSGIVVGPFGTVTYNLSGSNAEDGICADANSQVTSNTVGGNLGNGIELVYPGRMANNEVWGNAADFARVERCPGNTNE